jgi:ABC-2 type transport system permease protein
VLPGWMQLLSRLSPATYALDAMRAAVLQNAAWPVLLQDVLLLTVMGLAMIPAGLWVFARAETYAKRTGKLKRTG